MTYSIGQVLLHLFAVSRPIPLIPLGDVEETPTIQFSIPWAPGDWTTGLTSIWEPPSVPVSWPPEKAFDDKGFVYLADRWQMEQPPSAEPPPKVPGTIDEST